MAEVANEGFKEVGRAPLAKHHSLITGWYEELDGTSWIETANEQIPVAESFADVEAEIARAKKAGADEGQPVAVGEV